MTAPRRDGGCGLPEELEEPMRRLVRLEWWNIGWTLSIIVVMGLVLGQSQTMRTAWIEDTLGLIPPIAILIAVHLEKKGRSPRFPFGFERANGLGFFVAAVALSTVGLWLLYGSATTLIAGERPTVSSVRLFGRDLWLGWLMLAAQLYSLIPPAIIGHRELPLADQLNDKLVHTDALMNKANWLTGAAGFGGVIGLGMGWWWADSLAAGIISLDIAHDGLKALKSSVAELIDGAPRALDCDDVDEDAVRLHAALDARYPGSDVLMRETGRLIRVEVHGVHPGGKPPTLAELWPGDPTRDWRLGQVTFSARPLGGDEPVEKA